MIVLWNVDLFERFVFKNLRIRRQHMFIDINTNLTSWKDV